MKKTVLAVCIAMAVAPNVMATDAVSSNNADNENRVIQTCNTLKLNENIEIIPEECLEKEEVSNQLASLMVGTGVIAATIGASYKKSSSGSSNDNNSGSGDEREEQIIDEDVDSSGEGQIGKEITGDNKDILISGSVNASEGGKGVVVNGNNNTVVSDGDINVADNNSVGLEVNGDNNEVTLNSVLTVRNGGTGVLVQGNNATLTNAGTINVSDLNSTGVLISGEKASFISSGDIYVTNNGTGVAINGESANVVLDGNLTVDAGDTRNSATGVAITSNNSSLTIIGNVQVTDINDHLGRTNPSLTGINITGNQSDVNIEGRLSLDYYGSLESRPENYNDTKIYGLLVNGDANSISIKDGLEFNYFSEAGTTQPTTQHHDLHYLIGVNGQGNTIKVSGNSVFNLSAGMASSIISMSGDSNTLWLDKASVLSINVDEPHKNHTAPPAPVIRVSGMDSVLINDGIIHSNENVRLIGVADGGTVVNNGLIDIQASPAAIPGNHYFYFTIGNLNVSASSLLVNSDEGVINISSALSAEERVTQYTTRLVAGNYQNTQYGLYTASGLAQNDGEMNLQGTAIFGLATSHGTVINTGIINTDSMKLDSDEDGKLTGEKSAWDEKSNTLRGGAIYTGLNGASGASGIGVNTGTINVNNAGFGMVAYQGGTVINEGTINLTSDHELADGMYAMAAVGSNAVAVNDENGVININTELGNAFYTADGGLVINRGSVNLNGSNINPGDDGWGVDVNTYQGTAIGDSVLSVEGENKAYSDLTGKGFLLYAQNVVSEGDVSFDRSVSVQGNLTNSGTLQADSIQIIGSGNLYNSGTLQGSVTGNTMNNAIVNTGTIIAEQDGKAAVSGRFVLYNQEGGLITNSAQATGNNYLIDHTNSSRLAFLVNRGDIIAKNGYGAITMTNASNTSNTPTWLYNTETGRIIGEEITSGSALINLGNGYSFHNAGEVTFAGSGSTGIMMNSSSYTSYVVNDGVINVGTEEGKANGTNGTNLFAIKGNSAKNVMYNNSGGVINIWANNSYAFGANTAASQIKVVNNGDINLLCDTGCGIKSNASNLNIGSDSDYTDVGTPGTAPSNNSNHLLTNYTIGTNADGSAGKLNAKQIDIGENVTLDTGFTAGLSDREVTFTNVLTASGGITGEENITSSSVVWNAQASKNASGSIDVTMTKNDYADVITDKSVNSIAAALDKSYTSNSLYSSLNVSSASELNKALKQVSGAQAKSLNREVRILGQRFNMLANEAPVTTENGLSMNLVSRGDHRAEMDNKVTYDMFALRQQFDTNWGQFSATYGMARLSGRGGNEGHRTGDNGLTGGYSQFFGLNHSLQFGENNHWENSLRYDLHNLQSSRNLSFEGVSRVANASARQQHLEFRSEGVKKVSLSDGLVVSPFAGVKVRHHMTDGYQEFGAGDFNLKMNGYNEMAVDVVAGLRMDYVGKAGWRAQAALETGPNLGLSQSSRKASLQGMQGQQFTLDSDKRGGGVNHLATVGTNYSKDNTMFGVNAFQWQEDSVSDKGLTLNFSYHF